VAPLRRRRVQLVSLTRVLLSDDFGVRWSLPPGALCPAVPNRVRCLCVVRRLLRPVPGPVCGLDIGTGASCIYPLLGRAMFGWRFVAADADPSAVDAALRNVRLNSGFEAAIRVVRVSGDTALTDALRAAHETEPAVHFCICNPPFFDRSERPDDTFGDAPAADDAGAAAEPDRKRPRAIANSSRPAPKSRLSNT